MLKIILSILLIIKRKPFFAEKKKVYVWTSESFVLTLQPIIV